MLIRPPSFSVTVVQSCPEWNPAKTWRVQEEKSNRNRLFFFLRRKISFFTSTLNRQPRPVFERKSRRRRFSSNFALISTIKTTKKINPFSKMKNFRQSLRYCCLKKLWKKSPMEKNEKSTIIQRKKKFKKKKFFFFKNLFLTVDCYFY